MRPSTACLACRNRRRKCDVSCPDSACAYCSKRGLTCSLRRDRNLPPNENLAWPPSSSDSRQTVDSVLANRSLLLELIELYFRHVHDTFHSLFHKPTVVRDVSQGTLPHVILYGMISLSARFSDDVFFANIDRRERGYVYAERSGTLLNLRDISFNTIQACVLLGAFSIAQGEAAAEAMYYSVAGRMAMLLDIADIPTSYLLERETHRRAWWSLCMIDTWASAGVRLPRTIPARRNVALPIDETVFLRLEPDDKTSVDVDFSRSSQRSLLAQMVKLNALMEEVNSINELAATDLPDEVVLFELVENVAQKLEIWLENIPDEMQDTQDNLARYAALGLGNIFVAVYLGYYHFGQMLYYQFLHEDSQDSPRVRSFADACKYHATGLCEILYRAYTTPGCEVMYSMIGHVLVIASTVQLHILLFGSDEFQIRAARSRLERNFGILTELQNYWLTIDVCFTRFKEFHRACQESKETSFRFDRFMLRFLLEFGRPIEDGDREREFQQEPWTMARLVASSSSPVEAIIQ